MKQFNSPIKKMLSGANAARKAVFAENGISLSKAQVENLITSGASLEGIMITGDVALSAINEMLEKKDADKNAIMKQAYVASFIANGHTSDEASAMADEVINGADIGEVVRRYAKATPIIKSGSMEFDSATGAANHIAGLTKAGKKSFFEGLQTAVKVNNAEENVVDLGELFKKYLPAATTSAPDPDEDDDEDDDATDATAPAAEEMPSGRVLVLVKDGDIKEDSDTKVFAANVTLYGDAAAIKALTSGDAATVKAITKVAGVKTATADYFSRGTVKYLRRKNELSERFSLLDKKKKSSKKKKDSDDDED